MRIVYLALTLTVSIFLIFQPITYAKEAEENQKFGSTLEVLPTASPIETQTKNSEVLFSKDQMLLNMSNRLELLGKKAYRLNNIDLLKEITRSYLDLLKKNLLIHSNNPTTQDLQSLINEFENVLRINETKINKTETDMIQSSQLTNESEDKVRSAENEQIIFLNTDTYIEDNATLLFTPDSTAIYQFKIVPAVQGDILYIEDFNLADYEDPLSFYNSCYGNSECSFSVFLVAGQNYPFSLKMHSTKAIMTVTKDVILEINKPIDVELPKHQAAVFKFIPEQSANYYVFTGPFGGFGEDTSDALQIYKDGALLQYSSAREGIEEYFEAGGTYYIRLTPPYGDLHTRIQITTITGSSELKINVPTDISVQGSKILSFQAPTTEEYDIKVDCYKDIPEGCNTSSLVQVFKDARLSEFLDVGYSGVENLKLEGGQTYYIQVQPFYLNPKLEIRIMATFSDSTTKSVFTNIPYDVNKLNSTTVHYKFTPNESDKYLFWTSFFNGDRRENDTVLEVYRDSSYSPASLLASNDNYGDTVFSRIEMNLLGGTTYYIALKTKSDSLKTRFTLAKLNDAITPSKLMGKLEGGSMVLSWNAPSAKETIVQYEIYNKTLLIGTVTNGIPTFTVPAAEIANGYQLTVKAKDAAGNLSNASNSVTIKDSNISLKYNYRAGRLDTITLEPSGKVIRSYHYDKNGNLLKIIANP